MLFTANGRLTRTKKWEDDFSPLTINHLCGYRVHKSILRHLFAANEYLGNKLLHHNLGFYMWLVLEARKHILAGDFRPWKEMMVKNMNQRL
jgi:queuine tRNA-ribosyltransferase